MSLSGPNLPSDPRYPIGRFNPPSHISPEQLELWIDTLGNLPSRLQDAVTGLNHAHLQTPYRDGGWTVLQVVHHLADSHLNMYARIRLAITEENPTIKPYKEALWAELPDAKTMPVETSLQIVAGLHVRLVALLRTLKEEAFARTFVHPEMGERRLDWTIGLYAWHGDHHVAHITQLRLRAV